MLSAFAFGSADNTYLDLQSWTKLREKMFSLNNNNNNNNNNTYIALIRKRSKRFTSTVLQYDLEI